MMRRGTERSGGSSLPDRGKYEDPEGRMSWTCSRKKGRPVLHAINEKQAGRKSCWIMEFELYSKYNK